MKLKIVLLVMGMVALVIVRPWLAKGITAAVAPQTQTVQDLAAVAALLILAVLFLRGRR